MNHPIFISYYTGNSYYKMCSETLKEDCKKLDIKIVIETNNDLGFYWKNTLIKPSFIIKKIEEIKNDVIWIDVDTKIFKYSDCFKKWDSDILFASHTGDLQGIKASPLGIKYNKRSIEFLKEWERLCLDKIQKNDIDLDHDIIKYEILPSFKNKISIELMKEEKGPQEFRNGSIMENGISRLPNKGREVQIVIQKNKSRETHFNSLNVDDYNF